MGAEINACFWCHGTGFIAETGNACSFCGGSGIPQREPVSAGRGITGEAPFTISLNDESLAAIATAKAMQHRLERLEETVAHLADEVRAANQRMSGNADLAELVAALRVHIEQRLREVDRCIKTYCGGSCCSGSVTDELTEILALLDAAKEQR